jgi:hypothetical protein
MEKSKSMLSGAGLGQEFWAEAVGTTCYLVNRSPSSTLDDKNPHEVWSGKKPSLQHLRVFGCDAYVHVPKENRSKLDKKAEKCIFIGYKDGVKGYKLWNPETKKTVFVRQHRYSNRGRTPSVTTHITRSKINTPMFSRGKTPTGKHPRPQPTRPLGAVY